MFISSPRMARIKAKLSMYIFTYLYLHVNKYVYFKQNAVLHMYIVVLITAFMNDNYPVTANTPPYACTGMLVRNIQVYVYMFITASQEIKSNYILYMRTHVHEYLYWYVHMYVL